jgi:hydrogenase-4 component B
VLAVSVSIFSFGYLRSWEGRRSVGLLGFFYNVLLLCLTLVFPASNAFFFPLVREVMALAACCLVSFEHEKKETRNAGSLFLIMSHAGAQVGCGARRPPRPEALLHGILLALGRRV